MARFPASPIRTSSPAISTSGQAVHDGQLPFRKLHTMRHSYATWMLEEGADLRYVKDQMGHSSIDETEGTYSHLEVERHEQRVDLDRILAWPTAR